MREIGEGWARHILRTAQQHLDTDHATNTTTDTNTRQETPHLNPTPPELQKTEINAEQRELDSPPLPRPRAALAIIETYDQRRGWTERARAVAWAVSNKKAFTRLVARGIAESRLGDPDSRMGKRA